MPSPNTIARRLAEPRQRIRLLGPHDRVNGVIAPIPNKEFVSRGVRYAYNNAGCLIRQQDKSSKQRIRREVGGWRGYRAYKEYMAEAAAERALETANQHES